MPPLDETDSQLLEDLKNQNASTEQAEPAKPIESKGEPEATPIEKTEKPKTFDESYVKGLRAENARYRRELRVEQARNTRASQLSYGYPNEPSYPQAGQPQAVQGPQEVYDPRVDDIMLSNKLNEIKIDPDFSEIYNEVDEEGITFEERLLEKAAGLQWPIDELDALALKMSKTKLLGKAKQKGIDEAYKSLSSKAASSAERNVSSGKSIEEGEVKDIDDAVKKAMKEHGVTNLSELR